MRSVVALLGRRDKPTDGVEDYCTFLGRALSQRGLKLDLARVSWFERGWIPALWGLWRESAAWRGSWVLVQYTGMGWSRRGFPVGVLAALAILRGRGCRCVVVFHEFSRQGGNAGWIDRIRGGCQQWVIEKLYRGSTKCIFTVPVETVGWLPQRDSKATFIPIGANIPERLDRRPGPGAVGQQKTVIVFGVTGAPRAAGEVEEIASVMREASKSFPALRLVVVGRGSSEVGKKIEAALWGSGVEVVVRGVLPAEEVSGEFERADALLFVRGPITLQRGSAIAGIACGLPIVGYGDGGSGGRLDEAGIEWSPWRDREGLVRALLHVLSDSARWTELHERSLRAQRNHFSWTRIAERYAGVLTE
jgi:glycosyltransferase involved in cell wall biosynthesis